MRNDSFSFKRLSQLSLVSLALAGSILILGSRPPRPAGYHVCFEACPTRSSCVDGIAQGFYDFPPCAIYEKDGMCIDYFIRRKNCVHNPNNPDSNSKADYLYMTTHFGSACDLVNIKCY